MNTVMEKQELSVSQTKIKRALISVSDKTGLVPFAKALKDMGVSIISTGGTAKLLQSEGIDVVGISDCTGFPEMLDGRVKTLHPRIHGALLGLRDNDEHVQTMKDHDIEPIDLVVVNLYPFEATVARPDVSLEEAIENIDIGGPSMLRSAAKNYRSVTVVCDPQDYSVLLKEWRDHDGVTAEETRSRLALKVFKHTSNYDGAIAEYLSKGEFLSLSYEKAQDLRYGENPHQSAAFYKESTEGEVCISKAEQLQGKELSFNNIIDGNAALELVKEFDECASVVIKHTNPCGAALGATPLEAYTEARSVDPTSAFGSVLGFNREVDLQTAKEITSTFVEAVIAPSFSAEALEVFKAKANLRLLKVGPFSGANDAKQKDLKKVVGGLLVQERDLKNISAEDCQVVTEKKPTDEQMRSLLFAWKVCKHVKSNAIVYSGPQKIYGVGAGQMSRVDSARIGQQKSNFDLNESVLASDAFFPFRDGVDQAAQVGVKAIIQPGGSMRDEEVIAACNEHGIAMVFTGVRHFKH